MIIPLHSKNQTPDKEWCVHDIVEAENKLWHPSKNQTPDKEWHVYDIVEAKSKLWLLVAVFSGTNFIAKHIFTALNITLGCFPYYCLLCSLPAEALNAWVIGLHVSFIAFMVRLNLGCS